MSLRVVGAQIPVTMDIESNLAAIRRAIGYAAEQGADVLLTPEGSLSGYTPHFEPRAVEEALQVVVDEAASVGLALALGTCFVEADGLCYNQIRFYDEHGQYLGFHAKILRCGSMSHPPTGEIAHYATAPLRTFTLKGVTVGGLICNDLWANPTCTPVPDTHLTQRLAEMGAKVIFHAVNGGRDGSEWSRVAWRYHESNLRLRALAGKVWVVTVDSCHPMHLRCSSPSGVVSPEGKWKVRVKAQGERFFAYTLE
ncbi:MAG: carbon-nitrogen hydrolase family protein [Armatimonadota bacterium]|nr:carbon-nitrogen hydrolase family protein [bacterium]MDW8320796.1 carbon-nitrogen hydrolase family protein [Armatimonadota bacterium]